jgi:hypothetical protein
VNPSSRILRCHYIAAAALVGHCAATSLDADAWWYGIGLFIASLLFLVAFARDLLAANRACAVARAEAVRMERAARMRAWQDRQRAEMDDCCERWWTSAGTEHDSNHCTRKGQAA